MEVLSEEVFLFVNLIVIVYKIVDILTTITTKDSQSSVGNFQKSHDKSTLLLLERKRKQVEDGEKIVKKRKWKIDTHSFFWEECMCNDLFDFRKKYRINREIFDELCKTVGPLLKKNDTHMRKSIPVDKKIAIALHCLKSGGDFDTIGLLYNVGRSTVGIILHTFCTAIVKVLRKKYIFLPTVDTDLEDVVNGFDTRWHFKGVVGAIDGTHIPIKAPTYVPEDYVNYKGWHSIHALCFVDHAYRFRYVNVGAAGKNADGGVFGESFLANLGDDRRIFPENKDYHIIADAAFGLCNWIMKPFSGSVGLSHAQQHFNFRLSSARMVVECAFGRLKSRWRILLKSCDVKLDRMPNIVLACIILHNMCENYKLTVDKSWTEKKRAAEVRYVQPRGQGKSKKSTKEGEKKRQDIMNYMYKNKDAYYALRNAQDDSDIEY